MKQQENWAYCNVLNEGSIEKNTEMIEICDNTWYKNSDLNCKLRPIVASALFFLERYSDEISNSNCHFYHPIDYSVFTICTLH